MPETGEAGSLLDGWMSRCVLIASPRMEPRWREAFEIAGVEQGVRVVFLANEGSGPDGDDGDTIFVASDKRFLRPAFDAQKAVLFQGVGVFEGLDDASSDDARIHLIEMSRYAVEALEWGREAQIHSEIGTKFSLFPGFDVACPPLSMSGSKKGSWDHIAERSMRFLSHAETAVWPSELFLFECQGAASPGDLCWRDMTGPPRAIMRGAYIWATPGTWKVTARFAVDEDGARQELQIRWGPPLTPSVLNVVPGRPGIYEVVLDNCWSEPDGMELTIAKVHSVVSGLFAFIEANIAKSH